MNAGEDFNQVIKGSHFGKRAQHDGTIHSSLMFHGTVDNLMQY